MNDPKSNLEKLLRPSDPAQYSPLALAYLGDAVYEILVRQQVVEEGNRQVEKMHRETIRFVNAGAQAARRLRIEPFLTDAERAIYKRGRNATGHTMPKNQSMSDYRKATGFEALLGWLYLKGDVDRIRELLAAGDAERMPADETVPENPEENEGE